MRELTYRLCFMACGTQPLDVKSGMINIRADDDQTPDEVLAQFTQEQQVRLLLNIAWVGVGWRSSRRSGRCGGC